MKIITQSLIISFVIHVVYFLGTVGIGYIKTMNYVPDVEHYRGNIEIYENEVAFGVARSPFLFLFTFIGVAVICGIANTSFRKFVK
ncbi:hypothetical protein [Jeotgalibacillus aurantiacus]|uniref:hypothetical protein n=1 Tax=Jeotgalibacillus aurantiacus TaxID=2763266 RepID=UPI001D09D20F|nr:hypothetical protein [Jeotgalibacillus aurantiacus]